jgi:hypothetical protein
MRPMGTTIAREHMADEAQQVIVTLDDVGCVSMAEARLTALIAATNVEHIVCDASDAPASLAAVELLARLHLVSHRLGVKLAFRSLSEDLSDLVDLAGLGDTLMREPE